MDTLEIVYFDNHTKETEKVSLARLRELWDQPSGFFWVNIQDPNSDALKEFLSLMDIQCIWTKHFNDPEILPHFHDTTSAISFYLFDIEYSTPMGEQSREIRELSHIPLLTILGKNFVITYHQKEMFLIDTFKSMYAESFKLAGKSPAFLIFLLAQQCIYAYARLNLMNDNFLDILEFGVISGKVSESMEQIATAGYNILILKKLTANVHIIIMMLEAKRNALVTEEARTSLTTILNDAVNIREAIDSSRYLLDSIIAGVEANSTHKTGEIIQILTIISAIFMPLTLLTGIYGMNFRVMPGLTWDYGFFAALGAMGGLVILFMFIIWHVGWIGKKSKPKETPHRRRWRRHMPKPKT